MSLAPWRSPLARALHRNRSLVYARYLQLATIRPDGRPANRTVVFRGFLEDTNQLMFVTDARSRKIEQINYSAWGEVCWYFPNTREQFRLSGLLTLITETSSNPTQQQVRHQVWQTLSDAAREQFTWPDPGQTREAAAFHSSPPDSQVPLAHFCLLLLDPLQVDHLELKGTPQNRHVYQLKDCEGWFVEEVNP